MSFDEWVNARSKTLHYPEDMNKTGVIQSTEFREINYKDGTFGNKVLVSILLDGEKEARSLYLGKTKVQEFMKLIEDKPITKWMGIKVRTIPYSVKFGTDSFVKLTVIPA